MSSNVKDFLEDEIKMMVASAVIASHGSCLLPCPLLLIFLFVLLFPVTTWHVLTGGVWIADLQTGHKTHNHILPYRQLYSTIYTIIFYHIGHNHILPFTQLYSTMYTIIYYNIHNHILPYCTQLYPTICTIIFYHIHNHILPYTQSYPTIYTIIY